MMLAYTQGRYHHRYDPVFIAHLVQMKRQELGDCDEAPKPVKRKVRK
jgi:hypothetical protein